MCSAYGVFLVEKIVTRLHIKSLRALDGPTGVGGRLYAAPGFPGKGIKSAGEERVSRGHAI